ncbi:hypothetical protein FRZ32_08465 [Sphingosinicella ginsenosidimutans]|uniref:Phage head morphogenesis domain-containing protein n=2 Tax=Allosphingosinicella ginsenosidimutans TaxID=1176539 RepID=A0A5C6TXL1_9SPHN|nr:hypothetical protein FRZ32_08465 [Sphingosinicella ginsenosidimutans]
MAKRVRPQRRKRSVVLRDIVPPATLATDLYRSAYAPVVQGWSDAADRIIAEYARTLAQITHDAPADVQGQIDQAASLLQRLILSITPSLRHWALRVEGWFRGKWRGAVLSATGVDLQTVIGPEDVRDTLEATIARNVALVRNVSDQAQARISEAVFRGLTQRLPANDVAKEIRGAVDMARTRARNIAADQLSKLSGSLADERRREAGLDTFEFKHSGKLHPRSWHKERDGKLFSENPDRVGTKVDGKIIHAASEIPPGDGASQPPFCGCRNLSYMIFD